MFFLSASTKKILGLADITDKYIDVELRERHASGRNKEIKPDD